MATETQTQTAEKLAGLVNSQGWSSLGAKVWTKNETVRVYLANPLNRKQAGYIDVAADGAVHLVDVGQIVRGTLRDAGYSWPGMTPA